MQLQMSDQRDQPYRPNPHARANYDRLCQKHGIVPTAAEVDAIRSVTGPVSTQSSVQGRFETALLFFLPRSAVRLENGSLLIGWVYENDGRVKREVWFKPAPAGTRSLCHVPGGVRSSLYSPGGSTCDEWHPVIFDIVDPNENKIRVVQYAYFKACIKLLEATVPPPSVERSGSALSASPSSAKLGKARPQWSSPKTRHHPRAIPAPSGCGSSVMVDLTGSDEEVVIKTEVPTIVTAIQHIQTHRTQVEDKIQAFRDKLDKKEVEELEQMLEKELPSWIKKLAEDVLQKKMLRELDLAEGLLL